MTTSTLSLILFGAILAQIAVAWLVTRSRRGRQSPPAEDIANPRPAAQTTTTAAATDTAAASVAAWEGFREFFVQRRIYENGNRDICSFYLAPTDDQPLPSFRPGQFLTFRLQIEDPLSRETKSVVRCYTISDKPRTETYRISIKRVRAPFDRPDLPPGVSSSYFHDQVREGDLLQVRAPSGHFHLMEAEPLPMVLIAGGIGITPMLSILNAQLDAGSKREVWLFYGVRNGREQAMKTHLQVLADTHSNFQLRLCYSAPDAEDIEGADFQHRQRINLPLLRTTLKARRYQFYICGPKGMMESLVPDLEEWGVDSHDIYYESFGPATLNRARKPASEFNLQHPITIRFSRSGKSVIWNPATASLLDLSESNDIDVDSGCRAGSCGSCQTTLEAGEVEYTQDPDADVDAGHCLLCISTPKTDITLAA